MRISAVIPTYNNQGSIGATLASIVGQQRKPDEIIVVDDGSTDGSAEVIAGFPEVRCLRQANAGVSSARNAGIEAATGDWIALCDGDDLWHPEKLSIVEQCIARLPNCTFFFHDFSLLIDGNECCSNGSSETPQTIFPFFRENKVHFHEMVPFQADVPLEAKSCSSARLLYGPMFRWLILGNFILPSAVIFQRRLFEMYGGFDRSFSSAEDSEFFLRLAKKEHMCFLDRSLSTYRITDSSLSKKIPTLVENGMRVLDKNVVADPETYAAHKKTVHRAIARRYGRLASYYLKCGMRRKSWETIQYGLRYEWTEKLLWKVMLAAMLPPPVLARLARAMRNGGR